MSQEHLATYLNDHLAGATVALELLEYLQKARSDTDLSSFAARVRGEILADRRQLEGLMDRLGIPTSGPRKVLGWLAEKVMEVKLRLDDPAAGALRRFEVLEAVALGIEGKRLLWRTLASAGVDQGPEMNYAHLERRAEEQRQQVEERRLEAARQALAGGCVQGAH